MFKDIVNVIFGSFLFSVSINVFSVPNGFVQGGLTGISIMLNFLFPFLPVGTAIFLMNIPLLVISFFQLGKAVVLKTAATIAVSTAFIDFFSLFLPEYKGDSFLACVFCGITAGAGLGLILLSGATTGGTEITALLIRKRAPFVSVGRLMLIIDLAVILSSFFIYRKIEALMYAAVAVYISTRVIDLIVSGGVHNKMLLIITNKPKEISQAIFSQINRGVTVLSAKGGYTDENKNLVLCVARASEVSRINRVLTKTDENSFTVTADIGEVFGRGFRLD
ncbi:MAG: YitT family protein [Clostridia bacterium]|nr:YitT family protein [Clostridia bacterium]